MNQSRNQSVAGECPEKKIVSALLGKLTPLCDQVLLGYASTGLGSDLKPPVILVQLESIAELGQQGSRRKYQLQFNLSAVVVTDEKTTYALLDLSRSIKDSLNSNERLCPEARKLQFSETLFDISPNHRHLSFADMTVTIEAIF